MRKSSLVLGMTLSLTASAGLQDNLERRELTKAWQNYLNVSKKVTKVLTQSKAYKKDPVGAMDIMTGMMNTNINAFMTSSASGFRGRPRWSAFDDPNTRIGIDNPDTRYLSAHIPNTSGKEIYRIYGNRSNTRDMIILVNEPSNPNGGGQTIEDEDMVNINGGPLRHMEKFEVFLSTKENYDPSYMHNWLEIGKSANINVHSRYTACNYEEERPGEISIERLGTKGVSITKDEFRNVRNQIAAIKMATAVMENQQPFWANYSEMIMEKVPANVVPNWQPTGSLGIQTQLSMTGYAKLAEDEALVVSFPTNTPAAYGSLMLHNYWGSSLPWGHAQVNSSFGCNGRSNSEATSDGYTHMVISEKDPGVQNWLNTMGHEEIFFSGRLQSVDSEYRESILKGEYKPIYKVVKLKDLRKHLPVETKKFTEKKRSKQIAQRQKYQKRKYSAW